MIAIQVESLWKEYRLGVIGHGTLTHDLQSWWARIRGKEDPNAKVSLMLAGQEKQIDGNHFWALRDVNLEVRQGEVLGIIGKNGAGKSTLLKILSRVTAPTRGMIKIRGRIASLLEVGTGFHPELTGRENIFMNGAILGMSKQEIRNKLEEIIDFSGVEQFIDTPVKRYSSGMYVRLAFAVAAHLEPEILVVDEVLAVGDAAFQKKCLGKMQDISGEGRTVLFVSHNMAAVSTLTSRSVLLENGALALAGRTSDVVLSYYNTLSGNLKDVKKNPVGDSYCCLRSAELQNDDGQKVHEVYMHQLVKVVTEYDILQKTSDRFVPNYHLKTASGQYVACLNAPGIQPTLPGTYRAECIIPKFFLNEGAYSFSVAVTAYHECGERYTINFFELDILALNVIDPKDRDDWNYGFSTPVPGVIRPRLKWQVERIK